MSAKFEQSNGIAFEKRSKNSRTFGEINYASERNNSTTRMRVFLLRYYDYR